MQQQTISRKSEISLYLNQCIKAYQTSGISACVLILNQEILEKKVKFPLLEFCAKSLYKTIDLAEQIDFCNQVEALQQMGGNVILGMMLQCRLEIDFKESFQMAAHYISNGTEWYVSDIIGERVFGLGLLHQPEKALSLFHGFAKHPDQWVIRASGAGTHYAIKKGLKEEEVKQAFKYLLNWASSKHKEIRQGIGWAAKTTAKFHPDIIKEFDAQIQDSNLVANWFRRKIQIGLQRNAYQKMKS